LNYDIQFVILSRMRNNYFNLWIHPKSSILLNSHTIYSYSCNLHKLRHEATKFTPLATPINMDFLAFMHLHLLNLNKNYLHIKHVLPLLTCTPHVFGVSDPSANLLHIFVQKLQNTMVQWIEVNIEGSLPFQVLSMTVPLSVSPCALSFHVHGNHPSLGMDVKCRVNAMGSWCNFFFVPRRKPLGL
jgi:hypothetical protein